MRVPVRVWADEELWKQIARDRTLGQLVNVATLPGITGAPRACRTSTRVTVSPWAASPPSAPGDGIISPGGVGYDINCGVRLLVATRGREVQHRDRSAPA